MTIRNKMLLALTIVLAFVALLAFVYHRSLEAIRVRMTLVESIDDLSLSISDLRRAEKNYLLYHDRTSAQELLDQVQATKTALKHKAPELTQLEGEAYFLQFDKDFSVYAGLARGLVDGTGPDNGDRIREQGHRLYESSRGVVRLERERIDQIIASSRQTLALSILFVIVLGIGGVFVVGKDIVAPLMRIERATREVSEGNYAPIKAIRSRDEIGNLIRAFNHMVQQIEDHQEELVQAGKLASLGTLISGVVHELNNPLNNISMMAQTSRSLYAELSDEERIAILADIEAQCDRTQDIVSSLLDFSRLQRKGYELGDIGQVVRQSLQLVRNQLAVSKIDTQLAIPDELPPVHMNANRIKQVLINMFTNAIKAMPQHGQLRVEVSVPDAEHVRIAVTDTGVGMPPAVLSHIFDPFFTTRTAGEGTGLGLSVSYSIVKRHGGNIFVQSEVGKGSTFTIELPIERKDTVDGEQTAAAHR